MSNSRSRKPKIQTSSSIRTRFATRLSKAIATGIDAGVLSNEAVVTLLQQTRIVELIEICGDRADATWKELRRAVRSFEHGVAELSPGHDLNVIELPGVFALLSARRRFTQK